MLTPDTVLSNRYRIVRLLGKGGMGAVYEAVDEDLKCPVAVKETFAQTHEDQRFFKREARLLANLRHSALPKVMNHFALKDGQFLVMEFIPGKDLQELIREQAAPFPAEKVLRWADILLDALAYLHRHKPEPIIHRDVKPSNLKLTEDDEIILLDFGLAKGKAGEMSSLGEHKSILGYTPAYAPLEQAVRADQRWFKALSLTDAQKLEQVLAQGTDVRSDLFSLGATLYHLLTGHIAPDAPTRALSVWAGRSDPLEPANEVHRQVTPAVAAVLTRALALAREDRFNSAVEMRVALSEAGKAQPPSPRPEVDLEETIRDSPPLPYVHRLRKVDDATLPTVFAVKYGVLGECDDVVRCVAFSPDGRLIASGSNDNIIRLWEAQTGAVRILGRCGTGESGFSYVSSVLFSPDGKTVASGSNDKTVRLWDVETGDMRVLATTARPVRAVDYSRDGKAIVSGCSDGSIHILDIASGEARLVGQCEGVVWAVAFSPSGSTVASESDDNTIRIWNIRTLRMRLLASRDSDVRSLSYSPDGKSIAFGGRDQSVHLLDVRSGNIRTLGKCDEVVRAVAFSPDGKTVASASDDRTVRNWDIDTGRMDILGSCDDVVSAIAFSPDGRSIASGSWDKTVRVWKALPD